MANAADRTLAKWAVGTLIGSLGLVGVAKLGDAPTSRPDPVDVKYKACTLPDGRKGLLYEDGLCLTTPPIVGEPVPANADAPARGIFFEL